MPDMEYEYQQISGPAGTQELVEEVGASLAKRAADGWELAATHEHLFEITDHRSIPTVILQGLHISLYWRRRAVQP